MVWEDGGVSGEGGRGTLNWCDGRGYRVYHKYFGRINGVVDRTNSLELRKPENVACVILKFCMYVHTCMYIHTCMQFAHTHVLWFSSLMCHSICLII